MLHVVNCLTYSIYYCFVLPSLLISLSKTTHIGNYYWINLFYWLSCLLSTCKTRSMCDDCDLIFSFLVIDNGKILARIVNPMGYEQNSTSKVHTCGAITVIILVQPTYSLTFLYQSYTVSVATHLIFIQVLYIRQCLNFGITWLKQDSRQSLRYSNVFFFYIY